jgi:hypothetical protein
MSGRRGGYSAGTRAISDLPPPPPAVCAPLPPPLPVDEPAVAVITRHGWLYTIDIRQGMTALNEPYWRVGRRWAERTARRKVAET